MIITFSKIGHLSEQESQYKLEIESLEKAMIELSEKGRAAETSYRKL
ncbi:hypothetical protein RCO48_22465 [Peribacillus frigoritolerans]|nr:hypothetical protein [Peribacillus frigoritolerans]